MNSDNFIQILQKGFHVTLGATTSLIEVLQDPQKRDENFSKLGAEFNELAQIWAEKGEITEQEARNFVDKMWKQRQNQQNQYTSSDGDTNNIDIIDISATTSETPANIKEDLQELTAQIAAMRAELERLQNQQDS